jgi:hypothetical protein
VGDDAHEVAAEGDDDVPERASRPTRRGGWTTWTRRRPTPAGDDREVAPSPTTTSTLSAYVRRADVVETTTALANGSDVDEQVAVRPPVGRRSPPTEPSICSSISRFSSTAYSIGSSLVIGSMKPFTIIAMASLLGEPRLIR